MACSCGEFMQKEQNTSMQRAKKLPDGDFSTMYQQPAHATVIVYNQCHVVGVDKNCLKEKISITSRVYNLKSIDINSIP